MTRPLLSVIIPTRNRPQTLARAVASALAQEDAEGPKGRAIEVLVVDDASSPPARLAPHSRLRIERLEVSRGGGGARNHGIESARGRWIAFLDDDDELLPGALRFALQSLPATREVPPPVGLLTAVEVVDSAGRSIHLHRPPTLPRGSHFFLEQIPADRSFFCKQTLVVERRVLIDVGGFDPSFRSRQHTELFLRLNPRCSLLGLPRVTYRRWLHEGPRLGKDLELRRRSFAQLLAKHGEILRGHPRGFSRFCLEHAVRCARDGDHLAALVAYARAAAASPATTAARTAAALRRRLRGAGRAAG